MSAGQFLGEHFTWAFSSDNVEVRMGVDLKKKKNEVIFEAPFSFPLMFASDISCRSVSHLFLRGCCMISTNVQRLYLDLPILTVKNLKRSVDFEGLRFCATYQKPFVIPKSLHTLL